MARNYRLFSAVLIAVIGLACYANTLSNSFVWDDHHLILNSWLVRQSALGDAFTQDVAGSHFSRSLFYRPAQIVSYILDYRRGGFDPAGFHLTSIGIHIATAIAVLFLVNAFTENGRLSLCTALLFTVHPVQNAAVAYISGRADSLVTFFLLMTLIAFIALRKRFDGRLVGICALGFSLSLLSKETACIIPLILILYDCLYYEGTRKRLLAPYIACAFPLVAYCAFRIPHALAHPEVLVPGSEIAGRIIEFPRIMFHYLFTLLVPADVQMRRALGTAGGASGPVTFIAFLGLCAAVATGIAWARARKKSLSFFLFFFLIGLVPVSNSIVKASAHVADHWLYMPSIGYFFLFSCALFALGDRLFKKRYPGAGLIFAIPVVCVYAAVTIGINGTWKDDVTLYSDILERNGRDSFVRGNLALAYLEQGNVPDAIAQGEMAVRLSPEYAQAYYQLGAIYYRAGMRSEAQESFEKAIEKDAQNGEPHIYLGLLYEEAGQADKAAREYQKAIDVSPHSAAGYLNMGILSYNAEKLDEAHAYLKTATEKDPGNVMARLYLAAIYRTRKEYDEAFAMLEQASRIDPGNRDVLMDLGNMYTMVGLPHKAIPVFRKAIAAASATAELYYNLGVSYWLQNDNRRAGQCWNRALELDPGMAAARERLDEMEAEP